jgi:hypothetical protein
MDYDKLRTGWCENQLNEYYDMRYMQYFMRLRFMFGLSYYNEDDTVYERQKALTELFIDYDDDDTILNIIQNRETQKELHESKNKDSSLSHDCIFYTLNKMLNQKELFFRLDKMIDEYLLNTYIDMDEQELEVCRTIVWAMSDLNSGHNVADYMEVVTRLLNSRDVRKDIFATIKDIEDTIQRLVNKGILFQRIDRIGIHDKDGELSQIIKCSSFVLKYGRITPLIPI